MRRQHRSRHGATLACGTTLYYEAATFLPDIGAFVPCMRHGYCRVTALSARHSGLAAPARPRAQRRTADQLLAYLRVNPSATLGELRRARFTLRLLTEAARTGLIVLEHSSDLEPLRVRGPDVPA